MRFSLLLAALLLALCFTSALAHGDHDHEHEGTNEEASAVVILDEKNFESEIANEPLSLVEFFAPWCGHCKALAPHFAKAATALQGTAKLASVDCTVEKDLCSKYAIQGFPTLKVFRATGDINKPADYQGGRTEKDIVKYIRKQTEPAYITISTDEELDAFRAKEGADVLGVFSDLESAEAKAFLAAAEQLRQDFAFAISSNAAFTTSPVPALLLFKADGSETVVTNDADVLASTDSIAEWIKAESFELVGEIGPENFQKYLDRGLPLVWVFINQKPEAKEDTAALLEQVTGAAREYKGKLSVVRLDGHRWAEHAKHFGLSGNLPGIVIEDRIKNKNFIFPESSDVTTAALSPFFGDFLEGKLKANTKSQPEPTNNNGPVKVIVGTTFDEIALQDDKDVLVEFYAPWCGHCKTLAPKYETLGEEFAHDDNIVIAKVDATENDTPARIEGFPTLIFYPAGAKDSPVTFEGDRSVEAMAAFIRENRKSAPGQPRKTVDEAHTHEEL